MARGVSLLIGMGVLSAGCTNLPAGVCDLGDREAVVAWAADELRERNGSQGAPDLVFEDESLRFERIDEEPEGFWVRFGAENRNGDARSLYVRVHQQTCTYEAGASPPLTSESI